MTTETDRIEQDINESRTALNDTIERLGGKLSPGQIVDEALGLAKGQFGQFSANMGKQIRDNPVPLLLIVAGIGMYLMNQNKHQQPKEDDWRTEHHYRKLEQIRASYPRNPEETDDAYDLRLHDEHAKALNLSQLQDEDHESFRTRVKHTVKGMERRATWVRDWAAGGFSKAGHFMHDQTRHMGEMVGSAKHKIGDLAGGAKHTIGDAKHKIGDMAGMAKHQAIDMYDENPLAAGALGIAIGALLGSLAPLSSLERDKLQGVADEAMKAGAGLAERGAAKVEKAAASIVH